MSKKIIVIIPPTVIGVMFLIGLLSGSLILPSSPPEKITKDVVFYAILADPRLYIDGVYTNVFTAKEGHYILTLKQIGNNPQILTITLHGDTVDFSEDFKLMRTPQGTKISEYHAWYYDSGKSITVSETQEITITIDPNGETQSDIMVIILDRDS